MVAAVTLISALEPFLNWRSRWALMEETQYRLHRIRDEWIAAQVFGIELEQSAVTAAIDGRFRSGPLRGLHGELEVVPEAGGPAGHDRIQSARLLPGADRPAICRPQLAWRHPPFGVSTTSTYSTPLPC
jgi:hypothetical protein